VAVDHRSAKLQLTQATFQFIRRCLRVLHRQMRKARIAVRTLLDLARQKIVGLARPPDSHGGIALALHARPGNGQNGPRYAGAIHRLEAQFPEIRQPRKKAAGDCGIDAANGGAPIAVEAGT
jgi:hypothetical protein